MNEFTTEQRADAAKQACSVLSFIEHTADDILIVADWLLTGRCDVALQMSRQRAQDFGMSESVTASPDAAVWVAGSEGDL